MESTDGTVPPGVAQTHEVLGAAARVRNSLVIGDAIRSAYRARVVLGTFLIELPTPRAVRAIALAGFDFVVLDLEHSPFGPDSLTPLITEAASLGIPAIVRVWGTDPGLIGKVLDSGASGVMVPRVSSAAEAASVVHAARYAPHGERGYAPLISYAASGGPQTVIGNRALVIIQLESPAAIEATRSVTALAGIDAVFVGPYDLSQAYGTPGDVQSPQVAAAARSIAETADKEVMLGVYVDHPEWSRQWASMGFRLQCVGFDGRMFLDGARAVLSAAKDHS